VLREAARITDLAFEHILGHIRPGAVELALALEIERAMVSEGADGAGFGVIVASGPRSAMPHGLASHKALAAGELITFDFGAVLHGYHADMTRTVALGAPSDEHLALWNAVSEAHAAAVAEVAPGVAASDLDQRARGVLAEHGLAELFAHSLGHGVGLDIHEGPSLSQRSDDVLEPGMAITVEPGVYRPGDAGVRTEDLVVVTDTGYEVLSHSSLELIVL
jgi:Xaa-Pro aminopeptidase